MQDQQMELLKTQINQLLIGYSATDIADVAAEILVICLILTSETVEAAEAVCDTSVLPILRREIRNNWDRVQTEHASAQCTRLPRGIQ